jgi:drug/metabolite transporter (DMT)-like permease
MKGYLWVTCAALLWGTSGVAVRFFLNTTSHDPGTLVQFRLTLAFILTGLALACARPGLLKVKAADLPFFFLYGTAGISGSQFSYYVAIRESGVAVAIFVQYLAPVITALYEILVLKRRPGRATFLVLGLALGGSLLLLLGRVGGGLATTPIGLIALPVSVLALAFYSLAGSYSVKKHDPWTLIFWGMGGGSLLWLFLRPPWVSLAQSFTAGDWLFFLYLAVFSGALPFGLFLMGLRHIGTTSAVITAMAEPVWASLLAFAILGEGLSFVQVGGCLTILAAIVTLHVVPGTALREPGPADGVARTRSAR